MKVNPQAVGRDSGVPISLSNFLEDILQQTSCKNVKFRSLTIFFNYSFARKNESNL